MLMLVFMVPPDSSELVNFCMTLLGGHTVRKKQNTIDGVIEQRALPRCQVTVEYCRVRQMEAPEQSSTSPSLRPHFPAVSILPLDGGDPALR